MRQWKEPFFHGHELAASGQTTFPESKEASGKMAATAHPHEEMGSPGVATFRFSEGTTHQVEEMFLTWEGTFLRKEATLLPIYEMILPSEGTFLRSEGSFLKFKHRCFRFKEHLINRKGGSFRIKEHSFPRMDRSFGWKERSLNFSIAP